jgi:hypothetical protein
MKTYQKENTGIGNFLRVVLLIIEVFLLLYFSLLVLDVMVLQTTSFLSTNKVLSKCSLLYVALASQNNIMTLKLTIKNSVYTCRPLIFMLLISLTPVPNSSRMSNLA